MESSSLTRIRGSRRSPASAAPSRARSTMLLVTLVLTFPIGVTAAIYLEEFAPKNRITDMIRGQHQQPRGGALHRVRPAGACGFHQPVPPAALRAHCGRAHAHPDDAADDHHRGPLRAQGGAAVDPRGCLRRRRVANSGCLPPRAAAGDARNPHWHDHRHGESAGRDRATADDRDGGLHRRYPRRTVRSGDGAACANLPLGR